MNKHHLPKTWFVSRHQGSIEWIKQQDIHIDHFVHHLDEHSHLQSGDVVIGSLPVHLIAKLNNQGVRFISFELDMVKEQRGKELTKQDLANLNVKMKEYIVWSVDSLIANQ
jgi:CRISPR-associated protein Csx16